MLIFTKALGNMKSMWEIYKYVISPCKIPHLPEFESKYQISDQELTVMFPASKCFFWQVYLILDNYGDCIYHKIIWMGKMSTVFLGMEVYNDWSQAVGLLRT